MQDDISTTTKVMIPLSGQIVPVLFENDDGDVLGKSILNVRNTGVEERQKLVDMVDGSSSRLPFYDLPCSFGERASRVNPINIRDVLVDSEQKSLLCVVSSKYSGMFESDDLNHSIFSVGKVPLIHSAVLYDPKKGILSHDFVCEDAVKETQRTKVPHFGTDVNRLRSLNWLVVSGIDVKRISDYDNVMNYLVVYHLDLSCRFGDHSKTNCFYRRIKPKTDISELEFI